MLIDQRITLDQGGFHCIARMPKIELGASRLDRLSTMATDCEEGKGRGDSEQLLTDRLIILDQGVSTASLER